MEYRLEIDNGEYDQDQIAQGTVNQVTVKIKYLRNIFQLIFSKNFMLT